MDAHDHGKARCVFVAADALRGRRWDPAFWDPRLTRQARLDGVPSAALGQFVAHLTYGPTRTGQRPAAVADGVAIVGQKAVRPTGVLLDQAVHVAEGGPYDLPRCRLQRRDVVFCRSGVGSLGKRRFTVFDEPVRATVSCFVDLIRLRGINPYYVVTFLRSGPGWAQIERQINGVGSPNLSFAEIRSLAVPLLSEGEQLEIEAGWAGVRAAHAAGEAGRAEALLDRLVAGLEARLGRPRPGARPS